MFADDIQQRLIRKALFVIADRRRGIDSRQNRGLTRCTLRSSFDPEKRIRGYDNPVARNFGFFTLKNRQRPGVIQSIERIMWSSRSDSQAVNEKQEHRH